MPAKLVTIGDSLTQGFHSGAITNTQFSYPNLIAKAIGDGEFSLNLPDFSGEGGLPFNIERMLRLLERNYGAEMDFFEYLSALPAIRTSMDFVEDYWERGPGAQLSGTGPLHRNLAVWGFRLGDALSRSEKRSRDWLNAHPPRDNFIHQLPQDAHRRTIRRTLNPSFADELAPLNQIELAQAIAKQEGGIENLILWLGANNALSTLTDLEIRWSDECEQPDCSGANDRPNLWRPDLFAQEWQQLSDAVAAIGADNVFVCTIPHITIPPITRGISVNDPARDGDGYYEYYTMFWVWDDAFRRNPRRFRSLSREQAREIDQTIDAYNQTIIADAAERGWHVVPMAQVLDKLAYRRQSGEPTFEFPEKLVEAVAENPSTKERVVNEKLILDTRFMRLDSHNPDPQARFKGGIFSLDGIHPATVGYGLVAHEMLKVMKQVHQGQQPDWRNYEIDWPFVVAADSLLNQTPKNLGNLQDTLGFLYNHTPLRELVSLFSGDD